MNTTLNIKGSLYDLTTPRIMGIVNITPDSFYSNSRVHGISNIINKIQQHINEGADMIDIGAQSSNPHSGLLSAKEEVSRLKHILPLLRKEFPHTIFSIDTFYADIARMAVEDAGIDIINDISGGEIDHRMFDTIAKLKVPYILMHMRGTPQTMMQQTHYNHLLQDIILYFSKKIEKLHLMGINDVIIDPGFGFSKTLKQNYELMAQIRYLQTLNQPILIGISRKSMIYKLLDSTPEDSLTGTIALNMYALEHGARILRVHDVKQAHETIQIFLALQTPKA